MSRRAALLDRDGTLIVERHYLSDPEGVELLPGTVEGLRRLRALGFALLVVTNQSGLARGFFDAERLAQIHARLTFLLKQQRVALDGIYFCPHLPTDGCRCRKPLPGLVEQAVVQHGFDPAASIVVGDKACDVELGRALGARSILVRTGYGAALASNASAPPAEVVDDLLGVAALLGG